MDTRHVDPVAPPSTGRQVIAAAGFLAAVVAIAAVGVWANNGNTDGWYAEAEKVAWSPPNWLFGPAWSLLYFLIAVAGFLLWRAGFREGESNLARPVLTLFIVQLVLNSLWSPTFFAGFPEWGENAWWIAFAIIVALDLAVIALIAAARRVSPLAALLLLPYLAWILFATSLNLGIGVLN